VHPRASVLSTWQRVLLLLLAVGGFAQVTYWAVVTKAVDKPLEGACATWDREASAGVARLVSEPSALAEAQLDHALFQLRRARKNCRAGWFDVARQDYESLRATYPTSLSRASMVVDSKRDVKP
jgi:hypothetical protein